MASAKSILTAAGEDVSTGQDGAAPSTPGAWWLPAVFVGAFAFWLLSRPFTFAENDGELYSFMALVWADPHRFADDLFIRFGSQDSFSIFSPLYGALIRLFGLAGATIGLLFVGAGLWLTACWRLARVFLDAKRAAAVVVIFSVFHITYGGFSTLYLAEGFVTSRIFTEAFVLFGLAALARGSWLTAAPFLVLAAALHPLMALGGLAVAGLWESFRRPWLLALGAVAGLAAVSLAMAGLPPLDRLFAVMDAPWLAAVEHRNGFVFLANWTARDWANVVAQASLVLAAALKSQGARRQFFLAVLGAAAGALAASAIGADLLHSVLIIQLQLWRATWLLAWTSVVALLVFAPESRKLSDWVFPALFAVSLIFSEQAWPLGALGLLGLIGVARGYAMPQWVANAVIALCALIFVAFLGLQIEVSLLTLKRAMPLGLVSWSYENFRWLFALVAAPLFVAALFRAPSTAPVFAGLLIVLSAVTWDQRAPWQKFIEEARPPIAATRPVLWGQDVASSWFLLRSPSWLSLQQASGLLFSRQAALTWEARLPAARGIVRPTPWRPIEPPLTCQDADPPLTGDDVHAMCASPDHPGAIILDRASAGPPTAAFTTPVDRVTICRTAARLDVRRDHQFFVYRCGG